MLFEGRARIRKVKRSVFALAQSIWPELAACTCEVSRGRPTELLVKFKTRTDADRDRFRGDEAVHQRLRGMIETEGYPTLALADISFAFESQETIDREWSTSWRHTLS
jgi:hypothetical protein